MYADIDLDSRRAALARAVLAGPSEAGSAASAPAHAAPRWQDVVSFACGLDERGKRAEGGGGERVDRVPGQHRRMSLAAAMLVCACLIGAGCLRPGQPAGPQAADPAPPAGGVAVPPAPTPAPDAAPADHKPLLARDFPNLAPVLGRELLYLGSDGGDGVLLDATDDDKVYVLAGGRALLEAVAPFSAVSLDAKASDGTLFVSSRASPTRRNVPVVAAADAVGAANLYPAVLMERFLFSSYGQYATEEFAIGAVSVISSRGRRVTVEFLADIKPVADAFSAFPSRWGEPGADGFVRDRRLVLDLYGHGGFYCTYVPEWRDSIFTEGAPRVARTRRETLYRPAFYSDKCQALDEGHAVQEVLWEDGVHSYVSEVTLRRSRDLGSYQTRLYRIDRSDGGREPISPVLQDTFAVRPLALRGNAFYLQEVKAFPASEGYYGQVAVIDLATSRYTVLLPEPTDLLGKVADTLYIALLSEAAGVPPGGIYQLSIASGEIRRVGALLGPAYYTAYEGARIMYAAGGRLFIIWPVGMPGDEHGLFVLDPATGASMEIK